MKKLSHYDSAGSRRAWWTFPSKHRDQANGPRARVRSHPPEVLAKLPENPKGNPLEIARIAGIAAAKKTSELIPLCHPLMLSHADVEVTGGDEWRAHHVASVTTTAQTGVEMEALTAAAVAALTVYDMTKALDKSIEIRRVCTCSRRPAARAAITAGKPRNESRRGHHNQRFGSRGEARGRLGAGGAGTARATGLARWPRSEVVPDEVGAISERLSAVADAGQVCAIFTTGGTGIAARDVTPEATRARHRHVRFPASAS